MRGQGPLVVLAGGAGYIGLHVAVELIEGGFDVLILDDFSNAPRTGPAEVARIAGRAPGVVALDLRDREKVRQALGREVGAVVLLAGLKSVSASVAEPVRYYDVNLSIALAVLAVMAEQGVKPLVFSSSAAVYGAEGAPPFGEDARVAPGNPYGRVKLAIERLIADAAAGPDGFRALSLRYFNPVGAHPAGGLGEAGRDAPANLFPLMARAAATGRPLTVFGNDWPTRDGSCLRDYLHVADLARGHVAAVRLAMRSDFRGHRTINLGRGKGTTVFEAVHGFSRALGRPLPHVVAPRRAGDVAASFADARLAADLLGWRAERDLDEMCRDHWRSAGGAVRATAAS